MRILRHILISCSLLGATLSSAAAILEVTPGGLSAMITDELRTASSLTITGELDYRDFLTLSDLHDLRELDLSAASIVAYNPARVSGMMKASFAADELPAGSMLGMKLTSLQLPATLRSIDQAALAGNDFESITLPTTLTSIGADAFQGCRQLKTMEVPSTVTAVGEGAWADCQALTSVSFMPEELPASSFARCSSLGSVTLSPSLTSIGNEAFAGCTALEQISLPASLRSIGERAFAASALKEIILPASAVVGDYAFALCPALTDATFTASPEIGEGCFYYCPALQSVNFPASEDAAIFFPDYLFAGSSSVSFPEGLQGVSGLGRYALKDNSATAIALGADISYLDDGAMEGMTSLSEIDVRELGVNVPGLGSEVFAGIDAPAVTLLTAEGAPTEPWSNAEQWKEFKITPSVGVSAPGVEPARVKAWFEGRQLHVRASELIERLQVCEPSGAMILSLSPADNEATADMAGMDAHVYIVVVTTGSGTSTFKLTR